MTEDCEQRLADAEAALAEALEERNRLWDELNRHQATERELEVAWGLVHHMRESASWRLTEPLRTGKARYRTLKAHSGRVRALLGR